MYDQVVALYEKAISNIHAKNLILYLAFADFEEEQMRNTSAHEIYKKFLSQEDVDPSLVWGHPYITWTFFGYFYIHPVHVVYGCPLCKNAFDYIYFH